MKNIITITSLLLLVLSLTSCDHPESQQAAPIMTVRAKVLENSTITMCHFKDRVQSKLYHPGDKVWLNMTTHEIDDTSNSTMQVILLGEKDTITVINPREYQLTVNEDACLLYNGDRLIGRIPFTGTSVLDSLILDDNQ